MTPAARPQTIQIFLPLGDPRGIRIAEITTRIVQLIEVPRPQLDVFLALPESEQVAVYFLFGQSDDGAEPEVYRPATCASASPATTRTRTSGSARWC